jgi:hypothetical protein
LLVGKSAACAAPATPKSIATEIPSFLLIKAPAPTEFRESVNGLRCVGLRLEPPQFGLQNGDFCHGYRRFSPASIPSATTASTANAPGNLVRNPACITDFPSPTLVRYVYLTRGHDRFATIVFRVSTLCAPDQCLPRGSRRFIREICKKSQPERGSAAAVSPFGHIMPKSILIARNPPIERGRSVVDSNRWARPVLRTRAFEGSRRTGAPWRRSRFGSPIPRRHEAGSVMWQTRDTRITRRLLLNGRSHGGANAANRLGRTPPF